MNITLSLCYTYPGINVDGFINDHLMCTLILQSVNYEAYCCEVVILFYTHKIIKCVGR